MRLMLYISYDGSGFCGWQAQQNGQSVQTVLTAAVNDLFGHPCDVTGCSRTDSGVHARMFCATVADKGAASLSSTIPASRVPRALNVRLPESISVNAALEVPDDLHARYAVSSKQYVYRVLFSPERDPFESGRAWHVPYPLTDDGFARMEQAAAAFVGKRDFSSCMASGSKILDCERNVLSASVTRAPRTTPGGRGDLVEFRVRADGFLYNMVRIMAGSLIDAAAGRMDPAGFPARLTACDRTQMGRTAPACGLYLDAVYYDDPLTPGYHGGRSLPGMDGYAGAKEDPADAAAGEEVPHG